MTGTGIEIRRRYSYNPDYEPPDPEPPDAPTPDSYAHLIAFEGAPTTVSHVHRVLVGDS